MAAFLVAAVQGSADAAWKDLTVRNYTGFEIKELYISIINEENWGTNVLGDTTLISGESRTINYNADYRYYDVKIVFMNDVKAEWRGSQKRDFKNAYQLSFFDSKLRRDDGTQIFHAVVDRDA